MISSLWAVALEDFHTATPVRFYPAESNNHVRRPRNCTEPIFSDLTLDFIVSRIFLLSFSATGNDWLANNDKHNKNKHLLKPSAVAFGCFLFIE